MNFASKEILSKLPSMSESELDALGFGVVGLTDAGQIVKYSKYQSELANVAKHDAMGKIFFKDVAPCTMNGVFYTQFKNGVAAGKLETVFPYTFTYKMKPTAVVVQMHRDAGSKTNWVLVKKA